MIVTLIRHAEVLEEYKGRYNGHLDVELSENGKLQAKAMGKRLANVDFDAIYCSDLLRARQTLAEFKREIKPIFTKRLREKSWGRHEGKSFAEIEAQGLKYENFEQWLAQLDGEDVQSYVDSIREYFYETIFKQEARNVLVVTHSGVIKSLLSVTNDVSLQEAFSMSLPYSSVLTLDTMSL